MVVNQIDVKPVRGLCVVAFWADSAPLVMMEWLCTRDLTFYATRRLRLRVFLYSRCFLTVVFFYLPCAGGLLAGAIFVGFVQGHVSHAVHRLRPVPSTVTDRHVADHAQYDQRCYLLCHVPWTRDQSHPESRFIKKTIPRKGKRPSILTNFVVARFSELRWTSSQSVFISRERM